MLQNFNRYGQPSQLLTDNGTQFVNMVIRELTSLAGIEHVTTLAYSKEENAIVERMNKEVMRHLRALIYDVNSISETAIREMLPMVQRILNANRTEPNMTSPAQLWFGNAVQLDRGLLLPKSAITNTEMNISEWSAKMLTDQSKLIKKAVKLQKSKDDAHMANANPNRTEFPSGS